MTPGDHHLTPHSPVSFAQGRHTQILIAVLAVSVILRVAAAVYLGDQVVDLPGTADQVSYHTLALRVLAGYGFTFDRAWWPMTAAGAPTAHWSFLYTFYLVGVYAVLGPHPLAARLIQSLVVGLLQPYLAYQLAKQVFPPHSSSENSLSWPNSKSKLVPLLAAAITAIYAYFVYYAATLMTEPFYITAILAALHLTIRLADRAHEPATRPTITKNWNLEIGLGLTLAIAVLLRQLFLIIVPFLLLWLAASLVRRCGWRRTLFSILIPPSIVALAILPFTVYNYSRFGRLVLLNTNAGYALYWGNHPIYGTNFIDILPPEGPSYQDLIPPELRGMDEAALDQALLKRGLQFVLDDPMRFVLLSFSRIKSYFKFWPDPASSAISNVTHVTSFGLVLPFMIYGTLRTLLKRPTPSAWLMVLFVITYTGMHLLSWALIRYRLPVDAVMVIFASLAVADLMVPLKFLPGAQTLTPKP
jgi:hypothetical protein